MRTARLVTAALVLGSASFAFLPIAQAETSSQTVVPATEAWFQPNPSCAVPVGCLGTGALPAQPPAAPPTNPFPAGSLHVGVGGGQETARSYLSFSLPLGADELVGAVLDVPLDVAQADGSTSPETAKVLVCTFTGSLSAASGSVDPPPAADCGHGVAASYVATPSPHLHADLSGVLASLSAGAGLALLPDATKVPQTDAWRVVFSAHDRADAAKTAPASLTITTEPAEEPELFVPPVTVVTVEPVDPGLSVAPPPFVSLPPTEVLPAPTVQVPATQPPVQAVPQARTVTVGYAYPAVWLLPLAFLLFIPAVARALTQDLAPAAAAHPTP